MSQVRDVPLQQWADALRGNPDRDLHVIPDVGYGFHDAKPNCPCQPKLIYVHPMTEQSVWVHSDPN